MVSGAGIFFRQDLQDLQDFNFTFSVSGRN